MLVSRGVRFILNSSLKLCVGRHLRCKELWDHPWNGNIQILPHLGSASPGIEVGSSMIQGSQIASFSPQNRLQDSPLANPQLLKMLDLLLMVPFWCHYCVGLREVLRISFLSFECFRMWMTCVDSKWLMAWIFIAKDM